MVAVSRVVVHHDGGRVLPPDPTDWDRDSRCKQRNVDVRVDVDLATLPGPPLNGRWVQVHGGCNSGADIASWPFRVCLLCKFLVFSSSLHWPADAVDLGHFGLSPGGSHSL